MGQSLEVRFERYCAQMLKVLGHADREQPGRWYLKGLMLEGTRKSVEPMAARVNPSNVRSTHQSMHHVVAEAGWSDEAMLAAVAQQVLPRLLKDGAPCYWIVDDTGFPKKGKASVGVGHQYCGELGKTANCRVAVTLSIATPQGSLPVGYRLYLPESWSEDVQRRTQTGVPEAIEHTTKQALALAQIEQALAAGYRRGPVLADAAYGDDTAWREQLQAWGLSYAVGIRSASTVWWGEHQPIEPQARAGGRGPQAQRYGRDATHQPIAVLALAKALPARAFQAITWREGTKHALSSRFARVRVRAAHRDQVRAEQWLIIEWPQGEAEPTRYWLSNLPKAITWPVLVDTIKARWRIERDFQELKQELGLGHYEGRNWRGFHHHASLCIAAYGFLMIERQFGVKKNAARFKAPALPEGFEPRRHATDAATHPVVDRDLPLAVGRAAGRRTVSMPVLRAKRKENLIKYLITQ